MKGSVVAIAVALAASFAVPAFAAGVEDDVKAAYQSWDETFGKADAKALSAAYTDDALLLPPTHEVMEGPAGVEKFFTGLFGMGITGHKLELIRAVEAGDIVVATAKWSADAKDKDGKPTKAGGIATHVFKKQPDGSLKLVMHTFN